MRILPQHVRFFLQSLLTHVKNLSLSTLLLWYIFFLGMFYTFAIPPFQKPDEIVHFYKTVHVARGTLFCNKNANHVPVAPIPAYLESFPRDVQAIHVASSTTTKFAKDLYATMLSQSSFDTTLVEEGTACSLPFAMYLAPAVTIALPIFLHFNPLVIFFLGRLGAFLFSFFLLLTTLHLTPKVYRLLILVIWSLPTFLMQVSSYSKDSPHLAFGFLAFALLLRFREKTIQGNVRYIGLFLISLAIAVFARVQYAPLVLLVCLIPNSLSIIDRINKQRLTRIILMSSISAVVSAASIILIKMYISKAGILFETSSLPFVYPRLQISYLTSHIWTILPVMWNTIVVKGEGYVTSLIGITGWWGFELPWFIDFLYLGVFAYLLQKLGPHFAKTPRSETVLLTLMVLGICALVSGSLYIFGTPVGSVWVEGVQGRYFLLLLPFVFWTTASVLTHLKRYIPVLLLSLCLTTIIWATYTRFYDYGTYYYREKTSLLPREDKGPTIPVLQSFIWEFSATLGKKLAGVSIYLPKDEAVVTKPYILYLLDNRCTKVLREKLIDMSQLQKGILNDILVEPYSVSSEKLCWSLAPFDKNPEGTENLTLLSDQQQIPVFTSLYLY